MLVRPSSVTASGVGPARLLCVTVGLRSIVYPAMELARRLAAAGHHVSFAGHPEYRPLAEHHGLEFLPLEPSRYEEFLRDDARLGRLRRLSTLGERRERARESMAVGGFARAVRETTPDLVLVNGEMHEHVVAAAAEGARVALLNTFVSIWRRPGLPPPHHLIRPGVGWRGTAAGTRLLWLSLTLRKRKSALVARVRTVGCDRLSILSLLGGDRFDARRETDDSQWPIPFTYRRLRVLSLHALEFELPHTPREGVFYVGPMVLESRLEPAPSDAEQARLDAVVEKRRAGGGRKLIVAAFGSDFSADISLLRRLVAAVSARPEWDLAIGLSERAAADLGPLPEGVHALRWLPQLALLRHADVMVTHGGIGTIDECVMNGVPTLVYCGFRTDMGGTTARVVHHGIGIAGDPRDSPEVMRGHLERLIGEEGFRTHLQWLRERYAAYGENRVAERVVESLLASP